VVAAVLKESYSNGRGVSPGVAAFIAAHLRSVDDLQLLVAFINSSDRWWDTESVGRELRLGQDEARKVLERFAAGNLLEIRLTDDVRYQFRPGTHALHQGAADCVAEFGTNPAAVVRAIVEGAGGGASSR
jgi:hypothetical protein